jgi:lactate permease
LKTPQLGQQQIHWPGLDNAVFITTYDKPYAAVWELSAARHWHAILVATLLIALLVRLSPRKLFESYGRALVQVRFPAITTVLIVALAYLMNYSGMAYTLGVGVASAGMIFRSSRHFWAGSRSSSRAATRPEMHCSETFRLSRRVISTLAQC